MMLPSLLTVRMDEKNDETTSCGDRLVLLEVDLRGLPPMVSDPPLPREWVRSLPVVLVLRRFLTIPGVLVLDL